MIYLIIDLSCCPLACSSGAIDFQKLHARLHVLVACMLACRLHVGLPLACPLACQLACWLASPACELQPGCFCVVRLHVGLHVRLSVGGCHVVRMHTFMRRAYLHTVSQAHAYVNAHAHALPYVTMHYMMLLNVCVRESCVHSHLC